MASPVPEFSHIVNLHDLPQNGADYDISAGEPVRAALAARFGLVRIDAFEAALRLERRARGAVRLSGSIMARVTQTCVATLEPVDERVEVALDIVFRPDFDDLAPDNPDFDDGLDYEPLTGDSLDIGDIAAAELALSINPYPRAATAPMIGPGGGGDDGPPRQRPFTALGVLKAEETKN